MALHPRRRPDSDTRILARPLALGGALGSAFVVGMMAVGVPQAELLACERGLGAGLLATALAGLFACAAFGTAFSLTETEPHPHDRGGSLRPIPALLRRRAGPSPRR